MNETVHESIEQLPDEEEDKQIDESAISRLSTKGKSWLHKFVDKMGSIGLKVVKEVKFAGEVLLESSGMMKSEEEHLTEMYIKDEQKKQEWEEERAEYLRELKLAEMEGEEERGERV